MHRHPHDPTWMPRALPALAAAALLGACASPEPVAGTEQATIWGADDREDWREVSPDLQAFGQRHIGVLARRSSLGFRATPQDAQLATGSTRWEQGFCDDQPFLCQPRVGYCSGTLLDGNLFATAGHCIGVPTPEEEPTAAERTEILERLQDWCDNAMVVFNWREVDREPAVPADELPSGETGGTVPPIVTERDVYYCHEVLAHQYNPSVGSVRAYSNDITIFTLKRDPSATAPQPVVEPYGPAPVMANPRQPPSVAVGTEVLGIGFPAGLPMKFKSAPLLELTPLWARARIDILGGDSGGGLFTPAREHFAVVSNNPTRCPRGSQRQGHYCRRGGEEGDEGCLIDQQEEERPDNFVNYTLTYRAIDRLCGGPGWYEGGREPPPLILTRDTPYPSYLCGTAAPVAPAPYVPSPVEPEPDPVDPGGADPDDPVASTGCSASGTARGLALPFLFLLGLLALRRRRGVALLAGLCMLGAACSGGDGEPDEDDDDTPFWLRDAGPRDAAEPEDDAGMSVIGEDAEYRHVVSYLRLPRSRDALGLDLDGDGELDSALGDVVALFDDLGVSLSRPLMRAVDDGRLRLLLQTRRERGAVDLDVYEGEPEPLDPSGGGIYAVAPGTTPTTFTGAPSGETGFTVNAETFVLRVPLFEGVTPIELPLRGARLEGDAGEWFLEARLGGAVPASALRGGLFVPLADLFELLLARDQGCPADCESAGLGLALAMMDANGDDALSVDELEGFAPLAERLAPDLDTDGDGTADALSIGVELEAVMAAFAPNARATSGGAPKAAVCFDECEAAESCDECNSLEFFGCGWCPGMGCMNDARMDECEADWAGSRTACSPCEGFSDCESCAVDPFCGWCPGTGCVAERSSAAAACGDDFQPLSCR
ncbi:MAG TPA: hypothetical protein RMH85_01825 [Polyangiaceae bacterium LLY-WYZ-15_(1-7)]|nr:hypothetical protein [Myxococcales bacterium]HJL00224.1 hypothetical protein [Polyangiaceae bacterium LLY-WYZ-15_(1-7)]HJL07203.1 hypothetical protein [Polyangiaceae bacterium LLY-WYZ-15_(1-7)]HJL22456.1 hypothetical protein [Polyangiaceae bacterium LLY-WYZ-15_(1-7)]HJL30508.1 hypothetical protein [Polyangiaceae bacterium LLY-WYZ-15_(1-7)]